MLYYMVKLTQIRIQNSKIKIIKCDWFILFQFEKKARSERKKSSIRIQYNRIMDKEILEPGNFMGPHFIHFAPQLPYN